MRDSAASYCRAAVGILLVTQPAAFSQERLARSFDEAVRSMSAQSYDDQANAVYQSADRLARDLFVTTRLTETRRTTSRDSSGDELHVLWEFESTGGRGEAVLTDTPTKSVFLYHLKHKKVADAPSAIALVEGSFRDLPSMFEGEARPWRWKAERRGAAFVLRHSTRGVPQMGTAQVVTEAEVGAVESVVQWTFYKGVLSGPYKAMEPFVPERFPPLQEQIVHWSTAAVASALEETQRLAAYRALRSSRDEILLRELVRRGSTLDQVLVWAREPEPRIFNGRIYSLVSVLEEAGQSEILEQLAPMLLGQFNSGGSHVIDNVGSVLWAMRKRCSVELRKEVMAAWRRGVERQLLMQYLEETCAPDRGILEEIRAWNAEDPLDDNRKRALLRRWEKELGAK